MNLYETLLGSDWERVHPNVRRAHTAPLDAIGTVDVELTADPLGRWIARKLGLPGDGSNLPCKLIVADEPEGTMLWSRLFDDTPFVSRQKVEGTELVEVFKSGSLSFEVIEELGRIRYTSTGGKLLGVEAPIVPSVSVLVWPTGDGWRTETEVKIPVKGKIARYVAQMKLP